MSAETLVSQVNVAFGIAPWFLQLSLDAPWFANVM